MFLFWIRSTLDDSKNINSIQLHSITVLLIMHWFFVAANMLQISICRVVVPTESERDLETRRDWISFHTQPLMTHASRFIFGENKNKYWDIILIFLNMQVSYAMFIEI